MAGAEGEIAPKSLECETIPGDPKEDAALVRVSIVLEQFVNGIADRFLLLYTGMNS